MNQVLDLQKISDKESRSKLDTRAMTVGLENKN
ncbi:class III lanthipeptide [Shouchella lonarensis]|uniref:Uncharacterized protein n=1 Tax=Shouchella lonarensis TaxID=1464122 RepID=A0A1G6PDQ2_9BACI|nr:hypothetical protein SAMN05421737_1182 [Shouchella lonarensis]